ncbi:hypothetical protein BDZ89DRAFT_392768 [Hymenopellis radicata]|nr:hypothetical protein BDZ89DRAFT_392768 [Hymenopellis radicata]
MPLSISQSALVKLILRARVRLCWRASPLVVRTHSPLDFRSFANTRVYNACQGSASTSFLSLRHLVTFSFIFNFILKATRQSCNAELTRRDRLTRHHRTCARSSTPLSRRKSCKACAEGKIKCDLLVPCSTCTSRGKACEYRNNPDIPCTKPTGARKSPCDNSGSDGEQALVSISEHLTEPVEASSSVALRLPDEFDDSHSVMPRTSRVWQTLLLLYFPEEVSLPARASCSPRANSIICASVLRDILDPNTRRSSRTWRSEDKPLILVRSMQAWGALFMKHERQVNSFLERLLLSEMLLLRK